MTPATVRSAACRPGRSRSRAFLLAAIVLLESAQGLACGPAALTPDERFAMAQSAARAGDHDRAAAMYAGLLADYPDNVDYLFGYGQLLYWSGDADAAVGWLERAREVAPDYEAVWRLEYRLRRSLADGRDDASLDAFRATAADRFPNAGWLDEPAVPERPRFRWRAGGGRDELDNSAPGWHRFDLHGAWRILEAAWLSAAVSSAERFGASDSLYSVGIAGDFAGDWFGEAEFASSRSPAFLPETSAVMRIGRRFEGGWIASAALSRRDYEPAAVTIVGATAERYLGRFRFAYSPTVARLRGEHAIGHQFGIDRYAVAGTRVGVRAAFGEEIETLAPGELVRTPVRSLALTGSVPLTGYLDLGWEVGMTEQGDLYRRRSVGLSIAGGF